MSKTPATPLRLWYSRAPGSVQGAIVAAPDEETARSIPPFTNWRELSNWGTWTPEEASELELWVIGEALPIGSTGAPTQVGVVCVGNAFLNRDGRLTRG